MTTPTPDMALQSVPSAIRKGSSRQRIIGLTFAAWLVPVVLLVTRDAEVIAVAGAFAVGWSHLAGRCGQSHLGTLTPRAKLPGQRARWLTDVMAYFAAGAVASITVGLALGFLGLVLVPTALREASLVLVVLLAVLAAAGDLDMIRWHLPQPNRQTRRDWGSMFRAPIPAALWGLGLGVTVATVFTFSGTWLVLALPVAVGDPALGAVMLLAHWFGRAAPILAGPVLLPAAGQTMDLLDDIDGQSALFRGSNLIGITLITLSLAVLVAEMYG